MGVYHITYTPELKEICLYLDGGCNFSCHGCIIEWHPNDCHLDKETRQIKNRTLDIKEVLFYLQPLAFNKVIFLGKEPTVDSDFLPLAKIFKKHFSTYNILLTNAWEYVEDEADAYIPFNNDKFRRPTEGEMNKAKIIAEKHLENVYILHKGVKVRYPVKRIY